MPRFQIECADRFTGKSVIREYDASDERVARAYANTEGYLVGAVRRIDAGAEHRAPSRAYPRYRPIFRVYYTPKIAKGSAVVAAGVAVIMPVVSIVGVVMSAPDPMEPRVWLAMFVAGATSFLFFGLIAVYVRLIAELISVVFDIERVFRDIRSSILRVHDK